jgi:hypothetical protein
VHEARIRGKTGMHVGVAADKEKRPAAMKKAKVTAMTTAGMA